MDIEGLLRSLNAHSVDYVLIGAVAFPVHGYARATLDVDVFIRPTPENARQTRWALTDFGYPFVKGVSFDEVWSRRVQDRIGDTPAFFASLDDLIRMKEAAGRPKDLEDLRVLRRLRDARG